MRLRMCTWSSGWARFFIISLNYLRYLCEAFMLFVQKNRTAIYGVRPTRGLGCWTEGLTDTWGRGFTWCSQTCDVGGHACAVQPGRRVVGHGFLYHLEAQGFQYSIYILQAWPNAASLPAPGSGRL
jgi:hypothetical protein